MSITRRLFAILIVIFLLITTFNLSSIASGNQVSNIIDKTSCDDEVDFDGYIVRFKEESLLNFKNRFIEKIKNFFSYLSEKVADVLLNQNVQNHKEKLLSLHEKAKEDILKLFGKNILSEKIFSRDFITINNELSIKNVPNEILNKIESLPYIEKIFPNYRISVALHESVPLINADDVWDMHGTTGRNITGKGVTIAFLDSGVNYNHPDLKDNYIAEGSYDFVNNDNDTMDDFGHGTHCVGIAVGKGNMSDYQHVGVAPDAKFYAFKIMDEKGNGNYDNYEAGMEAAIDLGVDIVSLSIGTNKPGAPTDVFCKMADKVVNAGIVVVAAAGNKGRAYNITSPGCAKKVICVGATDKNDKIAGFSSRGPVIWKEHGLEKYMVKPDVVAPGVEITSASRNGGYIIMGGTSMSTPHVAGAAALILQANTNYKPDEVKNVLKLTAVDLKENVNTQGSGRIDLLRAFCDEDIIFINAPDEICEKQRFTVHITNKTGSPVTAWVLFTVPFHVPRLKYGSSVTFRAPIILRIFKKSRQGQIKVFRKTLGFNILLNKYIIKKSITVINFNRIF